MEIRKLFERETSQTSAQNVKNQQQVSAYGRASEQGVRSSDTDSVTISALSRQLAQLSQILSEEDQSRRDRVQEIRSQIDSGNYSVDVDSVARSMVSFAADSEGSARA